MSAPPNDPYKLDPAMVGEMTRALPPGVGYRHRPVIGETPPVG